MGKEKLEGVGHASVALLAELAEENKSLKADLKTTNLVNEADLKASQDRVDKIMDLFPAVKRHFEMKKALTENKK